MRVDIETCQDIELLRHEALRMQIVIDKLVEGNEELEKRIEILENEIQYGE